MLKPWHREGENPVLVKVEKAQPSTTEEIEVCFPLYLRYFYSSEHGGLETEAWIRIDQDKTITTLTKTHDRDVLAQWEIDVSQINFFRELTDYLETWEYPTSNESEFNEALARMNKVLTAVARGDQGSRESSAGAADSQVFNRR